MKAPSTFLPSGFLGRSGSRIYEQVTIVVVVVIAAEVLVVQRVILVAVVRAGHATPELVVVPLRELDTVRVPVYKYIKGKE
jgi:hypothetical protein